MNLFIILKIVSIVIICGHWFDFWLMITPGTLKQHGEFGILEIGSFFLKHLDQFKNNSSRKYSLISYLNNDWQTQDGGELLIHQSPNNQMISPTQGKTVLFKSNELFHEVLVTNKTRMSITGWLKGS